MDRKFFFLASLLLFLGFSYRCSPTLFFRATIAIEMFMLVTWILPLMCNGFLLLVFPFPLILSLLGSVLVLFLFGTTWLSFSVAYIFQIACLNTSLINCHELEENRFLSQMIVYTPQILEDYIWVIGRNTQHNIHLPKFGGALLHTLSLSLTKIMLSDSFVLCIPNRVQMGLNEGFEILSLSY
jgi:hypothetical protein